MIRLEWKIEGDFQALMISPEQLQQGAMLVGRSPQCQVILDEKTVSRHHAELLLKDDQIYLRNINTSDNIFKINDQPIKQGQAAPLKANDKIQLGGLHLEVHEIKQPLKTKPGRDKPRSAALEPQNLIGRKLGKYEIIEPLGQGGMAQVFKARQPKIDRFVAVKILDPELAASPDFVSRFEREAKAMGQLQHPHILRVIDFDRQDGVYYMVMDYIPGDTLDAYLKQQRQLPVAEALAITEQLIDALDYAHQSDMVHRDIKPENIMFSDTTHTHIVLTDFGLVRLLDKSMTMTGTKIGTPAYMSPEVSLGERADVRSDIYSLGVVLYQMLLGQPPFTGATAHAIMTKQLNEPVPPPRQFNPAISEALEKILLKALAREPKDRYQTVLEVQNALQQLQPKSNKSSTGRAASSPIAAKKAASKPALDPQLKRWLIFLAVFAGVLLVAGLTVGILLFIP